MRSTKFSSSSDQYRTETKPIKINSSSNDPKRNNINGRASTPKQFGSSFEDVKVDDSDENPNSPPTRKEQSVKSKALNSTASQHSNNSNYVPKQHNLDQQMRLESMIEHEDEDQTDATDSISMQTDDSNARYLIQLKHEMKACLSNITENLEIFHDIDECRQCITGSIFKVFRKSVRTGLCFFYNGCRRCRSRGWTSHPCYDLSQYQVDRYKCIEKSKMVIREIKLT